jgi:hypothetical protein
MPRGQSLQRGGGGLGSATLEAFALGFSRLLANGFLRERIKMPRYGQVRVAGADIDCRFRVGKAGGVRPVTRGAFLRRGHSGKSRQGGWLLPAHIGGRARGACQLMSVAFLFLMLTAAAAGDYSIGYAFQA